MTSHNFQGLVASQEFATLSYFCVRALFTAPCILIAEICIINQDLGPAYMGKGLSWLARKHFDKFTSAISSCYKNNIKSYTAFI